MSKNKLKKFLFNKKNITVATIFFLCLISIIFLKKSFALTEVPSVNIESTTPSYSSNDPGAVNILNKAEWTAKDEALVTLDVDTIEKNMELLQVKIQYL